KIQTVDWVAKQQLEIAVGHRVVVKSFSGSKAMKDYLKPNLELSQDQFILHHGNISEKALNQGGLHLNIKGNQQFFKNFQVSLG
ncbi:unnamed protein product, partial [Porites lobata]